ncbi:MAG: hypothetical protein HFJ03_04170 [Lachnospira sp.]|nr:hypothetical protein [Lachnospira sp.]
MFKHQKIHQLDDYFVELSNRENKGVYFYRMNVYTQEIGDFIKRYYEAARLAGVIIEGKIPNPDEKNLSYYNEIMGMNFYMNMEFISVSLKKWLPRMNDYQRNNVAVSIYNTLEDLQKAGKNENMLKNAYIKFMCWLYYKFERIVNLLGQEKVPKILYEGSISNYELLLISVLCHAGCDIVLLQYQGDAAYLKLDANSSFSYEFKIDNATPFPSDFNLKWVRQQIQNDFTNARLYGEKPKYVNCTNAWITGEILEDIKQNVTVRGKNDAFFYNCFCIMNGVKDKITYMNELYQLQLELKNNKRRIVIVDDAIPAPSNEEIASIRRRTYTKLDQMLSDLVVNIQYSFNIELQRLMIKAFLDVLLEEAKKPQMNINKMTNKAVYMLCWLKRYQAELFSSWKMPQISCFILMSGCKSETEALFLKILARLPIDVLILNPNLNIKSTIYDKLLYEVNYETSMNVTKFPRENADIKLGTVAYHAERELDTIMYQDSGLYRNQQYQKANAVNLQTMYEEIKILWNEELKYRPNFLITDDIVNLPVICAKVSGVKNSDITSYWISVKELMTQDTYVIQNVPFIESTAYNPLKEHTTEFFKNGKLQKNKIKNHADYQYRFLREEMQEHMLDKLQILINQALIKGTFQNGTEYTIVATALNLPKDILRLIQKFDFTKKNPKIIYINTGEKASSLEDSILIAFLNLIGFDILSFVPTGYQNIENYFNKELMEEHQIGDYIYDMQVPNFATLSLNTRPKSWRDIIFKRNT